MTTLLEGIAIGAGGGLAAGFSLWVLQILREKFIECRQKQGVYKWMKNNDTQKFRTTRAIASHNNITQDRVRYICSIDNRIKLSTGEKDDMWGLRENQS